VNRKEGTKGIPSLTRIFLLYFFKSLMSFRERPWTVFLIVIFGESLTDFSIQSPSVSFEGERRTVEHFSMVFVYANKRGIRSRRKIRMLSRGNGRNKARIARTVEINIIGEVFLVFLRNSFLNLVLFFRAIEIE